MKYIILTIFLFGLTACQRSTDPLNKYNGKFSEDIPKVDIKEVSKTAFIPKYDNNMFFFLNKKTSDEIIVDMNINNIKYSAKLIGTPRSMKVVQKNNVITVKYKPTNKDPGLENSNSVDELTLIAYLKLTADETESEENKLFIKKLDKLPVTITVFNLKMINEVK